MTSGQWTMGAMTKVKLWRPEEKVSPSLTSITRPVRSRGKYCWIMVWILALQMTVASG